MAALNPLKIPEILLQVTFFLQEKELVQCLLVCKSWYKNISSLVWKEVTATDSPYFRTPQGYTKEILDRYLDIVQKLEIYDDYPGKFANVYPKLQSLILVQENVDHIPEDKITEAGEDLAKLIALNPSLIRLKITGFSRLLSSSFWQAISNHSNLKSINLRNMTIRNLGGQESWEPPQHLETLSIIDSVMLLEAPPHPMFRNVRILNIQLDSQLNSLAGFNLVQGCPDLEELVWRTGSEDRAPIYFAEMAKEGRWPKLESITLLSYIPDSVANMIISAIPKITKLNIEKVDLEPNSINSLSLHFNTLEELVFSRYMDSSSHILQIVMCSCPKLLVLKGGILSTLDVATGDPWACHSLQILKARFVFLPENREYNQLVFERLNSLTHLKTLDIGKEPYYTTYDY